MSLPRIHFYAALPVANLRSRSHKDFHKMIANSLHRREGIDP
jgi:hypothetical protein